MTLSDPVLAALGLIAFLVAFGVQYGVFHAYLRPRLRDPDLGVRRAALVRWITFVAVWQVVVLAAAAAYAVPIVSSHPRGLAWIAPPLGAVLGNALPLQLAVVGISRGGRR